MCDIKAGRSTSVCGTQTQTQSESLLDVTLSSHASGRIIVVSNRLPFVLKRNKDGKLVRVAR